MTALLLFQLLAQTPSSACLDTFKQLFPEECAPGAAACPQDEAVACHKVVLKVSEDYLSTEALAARVAQSEAVAPALEVTRGVPGTPDQASAANSAKPVPLYNVSVGNTTSATPGTSTASTSTQNVQAVTITLNPGGLTTASDPKNFVRWARLGDLSVVLPGSIFTASALTFVGFRARADFVGLLNPGQMTSLGNATLLSSNDLGAAKGDFMVALEAILTDKDKPDSEKRACLAAVMAHADVVGPCGESLRGPLTRSRAVSPEFYRQLDALRKIVDTNQFGLTGEVDVPLDKSAGIPLRGQLTLVAGFEPVVGDAGRFGLTPNVSGDYFSANATSFIGGALVLAADYDAVIGEVFKFYLTAGVKAHGGFGDPTQFAVTDIMKSPGNYLLAEGGLRVPLGDSGVAFSARFGWGILGDVKGKPSISVALDYSGVLPRKKT